MNTYTGTELAKKINDFWVKKTLKYPSLLEVSPAPEKDSASSLMSRFGTRLEKMNSFWVQNIHS